MYSEIVSVKFAFESRELVDMVNENQKTTSLQVTETYIDIFLFNITLECCE